MRVLGIVALALVLVIGPVFGAERSLQTVIITPVAVSAAHAAPALTRADKTARLMEDAQLSQAKLLADLKPLTVSGEAPAEVTELHSLWLVNRVIITATPAVIANVAKRADVVRVRATKTVKLVQPTGSSTGPREGKVTYGLGKLRVPEAWAKHGVDGTGVLVGHIDTGIYSIHPDLSGKVTKFKDFHGSDHAIAFDGQGHGTHTAGTIAGGNTSGKHIGVAPGAKLICGRIFNNGGATTDAIVLRAMNWIADPDGDSSTNDGPRLVSNSWGGGQDGEASGGELWDAVEHWLDLGILPVFAAGNSGPKAHTMGTPGGYPHALAVGSTNWLNWASRFSSRGSIKWDGTEYIKPDVAAPGSGVSSAKDKGGYWTLDGTSMACPHVAGVAALMLQANPNLNPSQIVEIMRSTAKDLGDAGKDNTFGWGLVDAERAVEKAKALAGFTAGE